QAPVRAALGRLPARPDSREGQKGRVVAREVLQLGDDGIVRVERRRGGGKSARWGDDPESNPRETGQDHERDREDRNPTGPGRGAERQGAPTKGRRAES